MPAYVVGTIHSINDAAVFDEYRGLAGPTIGQYGGKAVLRSQSIELGDGNKVPLGMVAFEFENMAKAKEWYNSPEYQAALPLRLKAADSTLLFIEGA